MHRIILHIHFQCDCNSIRLKNWSTIHAIPVSKGVVSRGGLVGWGPVMYHRLEGEGLSLC